MELSSLTPLEKLELIKEKLRYSWELSSPVQNESAEFPKVLLVPPMEHSHWADVSNWVHIIDAKINGVNMSIYGPDWVATFTEDSLNVTIEGKQW